MALKIPRDENPAAPACLCQSQDDLNSSSSRLTMFNMAKGWVSKEHLHLFSMAVLWIRPDPATAPRAPQGGTELLSSELKCL